MRLGNWAIHLLLQILYLHGPSAVWQTHFYTTGLDPFQSGSEALWSSPPPPCAWGNQFRQPIRIDNSRSMEYKEKTFYLNSFRFTEGGIFGSQKREFLVVGKKNWDRLRWWMMSQMGKFIMLDCPNCSMWICCHKVLDVQQHEYCWTARVWSTQLRKTLRLQKETLNKLDKSEEIKWSMML